MKFMRFFIFFGKMFVKFVDFIIFFILFLKNWAKLVKFILFFIFFSVKNFSCEFSSNNPTPPKIGNYKNWKVREIKPLPFKIENLDTWRGWGYGGIIHCMKQIWKHQMLLSLKYAKETFWKKKIESVQVKRLSVITEKYWGFYLLLFFKGKI